MDHRHYDIAAIVGGISAAANKGADIAATRPDADLPYIECQRAFNLALAHFEAAFFTLINDGRPHKDILIAAAEVLGQMLGNVLCRTPQKNRATLYDHCANAFDRVLAVEASPAETLAANPTATLISIRPMPGGQA